MAAAPRPTAAEVDLDAIAHNARVLQDAAGVPLMAVVKADGYGHGAVPAARAALAGGAQWLAVATVEEGLEIREAGIEAPALVLGWAPPDAVAGALRAELALTVFDRASLEAVARGARERGRPARVHLKIDTGMGRLGFPAWESGAAARIASLLRGLDGPGVRVEAVYTHLACADDEDLGHARSQLDRFDAALAALRELGVRFERAHAANSAATLRLRRARYDAVRCGIALYGLEAFPGSVSAAGLRPALRWRTRVAQVKVLAPGEGVSYGRTFVPERPLRVAVLPVGYADGYDRLLSNRGRVLVRGRRARVLGRVCMDQIIVGAVGAEVEPGDEAVLLGAGEGGDAVPAAELAERLDTIDYEIVTRIGARVPRLYVGA